MNFSKPWNKSDQILIVEESELHVHRCVLSLWSPVFDRMFNSGFKETTSDNVELHDKKYKEIEEMLHVMYDRRKEITENNYDFLLGLAEEYQMDQLRTECIKFINNVDKTGIEAIKYYVVAERYSIDCIKENCEKELARVPHKILEASKAYQQVDDNVKSLVLQARVKYLEEIIDQFHPALNSLVLHLYRSAYSEFENFLRDHGLEETVFSRCMNQEEHVDKRIGVKFDISCASCRKNVTLPKQFIVNSKETNSLLDQLYLMTKEIEENVTLREKNTKMK